MAAPVQQFGLFSGKPERARIERRTHGNGAAGYAAKPGTGPLGETCATCMHCRQRALARKRVFKCALLMGQWTPGRDTDITLRSPACAKWEKGEPRVTTLKGKSNVD